MADSMSPTRSNALTTSSSAYLRSAQHQPIDWQEFGDAAFERARMLDRPILLDIGAVWCHWCHVIDRESYENEEIAALINAHYVAIKVDRDQRPDVDTRYQQIVQSMTGQGGWPLTAFLAHDGRVIYGGTYFPPAQMKTVLLKIKDVYQERKAEIFSETGEPVETLTPEQREASANSINGIMVPAPNTDTLKALCLDFVGVINTAVQKAYDPKFGGFGEQPKFPHFSTLEWMIGESFRAPGNDTLRLLIEHTLTRMAEGGVYDQLGGGFHRYSVDRHWHVPHFEKMAYDNAEALKVYALAYRLTGNPLFAETAKGIMRWVETTLSDSVRGGFYASQDADINLDDDGDYFTWSLEELATCLTPKQFPIVTARFDIHERGDMPHSTGRNVLSIVKSIGELATEFQQTPEAMGTLLASAQASMLAARAKRPTPFVDVTVYASWNGMMLTAWFEAVDLLTLCDSRDFAERSLQRILNELVNMDGTVQHCQGVEGFLDDYAWLAMAALRGYESTGNGSFLQASRNIADRMLLLFEDTQSGAFFDTPPSNSRLTVLQMKRKPAEDNPSSSANAVALQVLQRLSVMLNEIRYQESFERGLNLLIHLNGNYGLFVSALGVVAQQYLYPPVKIELFAPDEGLIAASQHAFWPGKMLSYLDKGHDTEEMSEVHICQGTRCFPPVFNEAELLETLATIRTSMADLSNS